MYDNVYGNNEEMTMNITKTIEYLLKTKYSEMSPLFINIGQCEDFAIDVTKIVPEAKAVWSYDWYDVSALTIMQELSIGHCFVVFNNRFYDSETSLGVNDLLNLPFFDVHDARKVIEKYCLTTH